MRASTTPTHLGGLGRWFHLGSGVGEALRAEARAEINAASFYLRGVIAALAMIGVLLVALRFSPAGNAADQRFRRDILSMAESEKIAQKSANQAFQQFRNHQITGKEFAERIDNEVVPRWMLIQKTLQRDRVADNSKLKPLWEYFSDYSDSRLAAFQLYASGGPHRESCGHQSRAGESGSRGYRLESHQRFESAAKITVAIHLTLGL